VAPFTGTWLEGDADVDTSCRCHAGHGRLQLRRSLIADQSASSCCKADAAARRAVAAGRGVTVALGWRGGQTSGLAGCLGGALAVSGGRGGFAIARY
jgi:hypothetical protein